MSYRTPTLSRFSGRRGIGLSDVVVFCLIFFLQVNPLPAQNYPMRTYTVDDGLASSTIHGITQDPNGLMWFATARGISCYDGVSCQNFGRLEGLLQEGYYFIHPDARGNIWACTDDLYEGLVFLPAQTQRWVHIPGPERLDRSPMGIRAMVLLDSGGLDGMRIGVATHEQGFFIYNGKSWSHTQPDAPPTLTTQPRITSLDAFGRYFYLATDRGLYYVDAFQSQKWQPIPLAYPGSLPSALSVEKTIPPQSAQPLAPRIWLCGEEWAGYYADKKLYTIFRGSLPFFAQEKMYKELTILPDSFGGLWVGNNFFICHVKADGTMSHIRLQSDLITDGASCLFIDREYNLWLGNFRGANKVSGYCFENYNRLDGLYEDEVTALLEYRPGSFIFGHNGGFSLLIGNTIVKIEPDQPGKRFAQAIRVLDMCLDRQGHVWAAISKKGILRLTIPAHIPSPNTFKTLSLDNPGPRATLHHRWYYSGNGLDGADQYDSIACSPGGDVLAIAGSTLYRWDSRKDAFFPLTTQGIRLQLTRRLIIDRDGTFFIASQLQGLLYFTWPELYIRRYFSPTQRSANSVYAVFRYAADTLLVGTSAGLFVVSGEHLERPAPPLPRIEAPIYFMLREPSGAMWFGLGNGALRWNGTQLRHYRMADGLVGRETNRAAGLVDSLGRVWLGMDMGASCYHAGQELPLRPPPLTQLLYLEVSGTRLPLQQNNSLPYHQNDLSFFFRGISYVHEPSITYQIKLEGFDKQWNSQAQSAGNQVRYTNLAPGEYRFHLKAINRDGVASSVLSSSTITIRKPFFQTLWFYVLVATALSATVLSLNYALSRKRRATQLEKQVRLRTRELEESRQELRDIFNFAHDALFIFDPETEIIFDANQRACDIYGFPRSEFVGMSLKSISQNVRAGEEQILKTLERGIYQSFESTQFRKDGTKMFLEINASVINYRGNKAILSINRDVTPRKLADMKLQASLKEKESLLKEIHHRVKNNLQIISSLLDLHADTLEDQQINRVFMDSKNRIYSMALLHENLYQSQDLARININDYIQDIFDHFFSIFGDVVDRVRTHSHISSIPLGMDAALPLGLILTELVSNALKYAFPSPRTGNITITLNRLAPARLLLTFSDDGIGLPPELDLNTCESLGIQLVTILARQLNGTLEVERVNGTTFKISFPFTEESESNQEGASND